MKEQSISRDKCQFITNSILLALLPARYVLATLGSIAMAIIYGLKVNLSVALVAMLNHTAISQANSHAEQILEEYENKEPVCSAGSNSSEQVEVG